MFISFGYKLLNTSFIECFEFETCADTWRIAAYGSDNKLIASESFGNAEAMAKARMTIIKEKLL